MPVLDLKFRTAKIELRRSASGKDISHLVDRLPKCKKIRKTIKDFWSS